MISQEVAILLFLRWRYEIHKAIIGGVELIALCNANSHLGCPTLPLMVACFALGCWRPRSGMIAGSSFNPVGAFITQIAQIFPPEDRPAKPTVPLKPPSRLAWMKQNQPKLTPKFEPHLGGNVIHVLKNAVRILRIDCEPALNDSCTFRVYWLSNAARM